MYCKAEMIRNRQAVTLPVTNLVSNFETLHMVNIWLTKDRSHTVRSVLAPTRVTINFESYVPWNVLRTDGGQCM